MHVPKCIHVPMSTKITIILSQDVCTRATRNHNESIDFGEKLATVCFKLRDTVHERHKINIVPFVGHAYR